MKAEMDVETNRKALQINLDAKKYGTFAEIGAGQEVARRFFLVGGAAGTIAKTMSAYDMTFSDWQEIGSNPKWDPRNRDTADTAPGQPRRQGRGTARMRVAGM